MKTALLAFAILFINTLQAQENIGFKKQFTVSYSYSYANGTMYKKAGRGSAVQMSYQLSPQFSIASEFETLAYKLPGFYPDMPPAINKQDLSQYYYSLLVKYHLPFNSKLRASVASGWSLVNAIDRYYDYEYNGIDRTTRYTTSANTDYSIPFLAEATYPILKKLSAGVRFRYNVKTPQGNTYSAGIGASLAL